ncbi:hypothetical protein IMSAG249_00492 [Lachnospiraceae bacterium]|nr:hypothetical protein IMSAG249_00492 [Lachnospiraceae bacterium]
MAVKEMERTAYDVEEIKIEGLEPTPKMKELLEKEKRGEITKEEIRDIFSRERYRMKI